MGDHLWGISQLYSGANGLLWGLFQHPVRDNHWLVCLNLSYIPYSNVTLQVVISKIDPKKINRTSLMQKDIRTVKFPPSRANADSGEIIYVLQNSTLLFSFFFHTRSTLKFVKSCAFLHPYKLGEYTLYRSTQTLLRVKESTANNYSRATCIIWDCPGLIQNKMSL